MSASAQTPALTMDPGPPGAGTDMPSRIGRNRPFWDELRHAMITYGGNLTGFFGTRNKPPFDYDLSGDADPKSPTAPPRLPALATGPP